ncbi:hypothetical protein [uncultured Ferrimonas sp.]|uniref:hypothetical protein n=1 Tax=uncultured Ferrimonas sp. TaxID=432640 RepID=UPI00261AD2EF|nr:hypothetical protein [uncultured Ferrimonas sp.]
MTEQTFEPKANDELVCLILHAQHLINAQTLYRQDISEQFNLIFQPEGEQLICPISDQQVASADFPAWLGQFQSDSNRRELGDVIFVAIGTMLQLWSLRQ